MLSTNGDYQGARFPLANKPKKEHWLIFVDTNILLDFYRLGGESAKRQLKALERHKDILITGDQVRMEYLKNRQTVIVEAIRKLEKPSKVSYPPIITDYEPAKMMAKHLDHALGNHKKIHAKVERILRDPIRNDPVYQALNRIFDHESPYNLRRPDKKRFLVRSQARRRFALGYPPRKKGDTSIGDAVNWEWIIDCAINSDEKHNILIVSRDNDFGLSYGKETILNDWLKREFNARVGRKRKIELSNKLTDGLKLLNEKITPEDEKLEDEIIRSQEFEDDMAIMDNIDRLTERLEKWKLHRTKVEEELKGLIE